MVSSHIYACVCSFTCTHAAHDHMQVFSNAAFHRIVFLSVQISVLYMCNPGRIRDLALFSLSVQFNLLHCTRQEGNPVTRDGCRAPAEAPQAAPQAALDRQPIAYRQSDHHPRLTRRAARIRPFFFSCSFNQSESARDMTSQPGYDLSPSNLMRIGHVCVCACGCLHVQACRLLLFMIFCSCCCRTCCSFLQTRHVMCFAPKELK